MKGIQDCIFAAALVPQSINDTATAGTAVDTQPNGNKASHVTFVFGLGATTADFDAAAVFISECETSGGSYTAITGTVLLGSTGLAILSTDDNGVWTIDVPITGGRKRFLKLNADPGAAATLMAAFAILSGCANTPSTAAQAGLVDWKRIG